MELFELGQQYAHSAELVTELIHKYTLQMRTARATGDCNAEYKLKQKLCDLYRQREHLRDISRHLIHYYDIH
ncbi:MAG: hypothetical protein PUB99_01220 [Oscillospiraceae bacterium]|nr:hypothetical protein [Oscillospiraceae bacterium]